MINEGLYSLRKIVNTGLVEVPTIKWFNSSWGNVSLSEVDTPITQKELSFITYNVWFEPHNFKNRINSLFMIFEKYSPDFICLQEVTQEFINGIIAQNFIRENYYISGNFKGGYDVLILSKFPVRFYVKNFKTRMGRNLLIAETIYSKNNELFPLLVGTSHFESLNNAPFRKAQLEDSFNILNTSTTSLLMGDFNFDPSWEQEQKVLDQNYSDSFQVWKERNYLDIEGYTMPKTHQFPAWRPDRILFKSLSLNYFEILGVDPIDQEQGTCYAQVLTPSDHYGLFSKFNI